MGWRRPWRGGWDGIGCGGSEICDAFIILPATGRIWEAFISFAVEVFWREQTGGNGAKGYHVEGGCGVRAKSGVLFAPCESVCC
jgi:hypothetical protein